MAIYMELGDAKGNVTAKGYEQQIEVFDTRWSTMLDVRSAVGTDEDRTSGSSAVSEMTFTKPIDSSSFYVTQSALQSKALKCIVTYTRTDQGKEAEWRTITLTDAIISQLTNTTDASGKGMERVSLNFTVIEISDQTSGSKSEKKGGPFIVTYNLADAATK